MWPRTSSGRSQSWSPQQSWIRQHHSKQKRLTAAVYLLPLVTKSCKKSRYRPVQNGSHNRIPQPTQSFSSDVWFFRFRKVRSRGMQTEPCRVSEPFLRLIGVPYGSASAGQREKTPCWRLAVLPFRRSTVLRTLERPELGYQISGPSSSRSLPSFRPREVSWYSDQKESSLDGSVVRKAEKQRCDRLPGPHDQEELSYTITPAQSDPCDTVSTVLLIRNPFTTSSCLRSHSPTYDPECHPESLFSMDPVSSPVQPSPSICLPACDMARPFPPRYNRSRAGRARYSSHTRRP